MKAIFISILFIILSFTIACQVPIQECPDEWIVNEMPCVNDEDISKCNYENEGYYILDGQRVEIKDFDTAWVGENCIVEPTIVQ
jgi:hypothetical protein